MAGLLCLWQTALVIWLSWQREEERGGRGSPDNGVIWCTCHSTYSTRADLPTALLPPHTTWYLWSYEAYCCWKIHWVSKSSFSTKSSGSSIPSLTSLTHEMWKPIEYKTWLNVHTLTQMHTQSVSQKHNYSGSSNKAQFMHSYVKLHSSWKKLIFTNDSWCFDRPPRHQCFVNRQSATNRRVNKLASMTSNNAIC